jgi:hypothetical protein
VGLDDSEMTASTGHLGQNPTQWGDDVFYDAEEGVFYDADDLYEF